MRRFKSWIGRRQTLATTTRIVASSRQCIIQVFASHQLMQDSAVLAASSWRWMALFAATMATASSVAITLPATPTTTTHNEHDDCNYKPRSYPRITQSRIPMKALLSRRHYASCETSHMAHHTDDLVVDRHGCSSALFAPAQWYRAAQLARLSYANSVLDIGKGLQYIPLLRSSNGHASKSATLPLEPPLLHPRGVVLSATPSTRVAAQTKSASKSSLNSTSTLSRDFASKESRYQLVYATTQSAPGQPAHFLAVAADSAVALDACDGSNDNDKQGDSDSSNNNALNAIVAAECSSHDDVLSVVLVIRGTQSISTDLMPIISPDLMNALSVAVDPLGTTTTAIEKNAVSVVSYSIPNRSEKGADTTWTSGRAHSYFLQCGQWIVDLHHDRLWQLCRNVPPHGRVEMTLIGHSLGAAVAVMAGLEWSRRFYEQQQQDGAPNVVVKVIGLGCPPLLSPNLAAQCQDWVTTLVYKDDVIPRLSVDMLSNLVNKMHTTTWDETSLWNQFQGNMLVESLLQQPTDRAPLANGFLNGNMTAQLLMKAILLSLLDPDQPSCGSVPVELVPPGTCVQIHRECDRKSHNVVSARIVPNSFYSEIRLSPQIMDDHSLQHGYLPALWNLQRQGRDSKDHTGS